MREALRIPEQLYVPQPNGTTFNTGEYLRDFRSEAVRGTTQTDSILEVGTTVMEFVPDAMGEALFDIFNSVPQGVRKKLTYDAYAQAVTVDGEIVAFNDMILAGYDYEKVIDHISEISNIKKVGKSRLIRSYMETIEGSVESMRERTRLHRERLSELHERFFSIGTDITVTNPPKHRLIPFTGRSHAKGSWVEHENPEDSVFYLQTANVEDSPRFDVIVKIKGQTAQKLIEKTREITENPPQQDEEVQIADNMWAYTDCGLPGQSIILQKAEDLIQNAYSFVQNCSLLPPDGKIAKSLSQAHKQGKNVEVVTSGIYPEGFPFYTVGNAFYGINTIQRILAAAHGYDFPVYVNPYDELAHAKILIVDRLLPTGEIQKVLFVGSHNLSESGVKAGTREMQVLITDQAIVESVQRRFNDFKTAIGTRDASKF